MKSRCLYLNRPLRIANRNHTCSDMCGVLLVMSKYRQRILRCRSPVWKRSRSESSLTNRPAINKKLRSIADIEVIAGGEFHHQIVRMLAVNNGKSKGGLSSLKEERISTL